MKAPWAWTFPRYAAYLMLFAVMVASVLQGQQAGGSLAPSVLRPETNSVIILIHGWTQDDPIADRYSSGSLARLKTALEQRVANSGNWEVLVYDWRTQAATGPLVEGGLWPPHASRTGFFNARSAAANAFVEGKFIADQLKQLSAVKKVIFIAHSAGSWAAYRAIDRLMEEMPEIVCSLVLLDPFVPGVSPTELVLTNELMSSLVGQSFSGRLYSLENYFSLDLTDKFGSGLIEGAPFATSQTFNWRLSDVRGLRVDWLGNYNDGDSRIADRVHGYPLGHSGPIEFYTDTIHDLKEPLRSTRDELLPFGVRTQTIGWGASIFMQEPHAVKVEMQGGDAGVDCELRAGPFVSRMSNLHFQSINDVEDFRWQRKRADGAWEDMTGTGAQSHISGIYSAALRFSPLRVSDAGAYRVTFVRRSGQRTPLSGQSQPVNVHVREVAVGTGAPPTAPTSLVAHVAGASQVNLGWTNTATNATGFRIERRTGADGAWQSVTSQATNATTYSDQGLSSGVSYYYRVAAYNSAGISSFSNVVSASTPASSLTPRVLSVGSANPQSGAYIYISTDRNGAGDAMTPFTRSYSGGRVVTLIASTPVAGQAFVKWQKNGSDYSLDPVAYVTMDADNSLTAVYGTTSSGRTLTSLALSGPASITEGGTASFTATATFSDGVTLVVSPQQWNLVQGSSVASISSAGLLTTSSVNADSTVTLQATYSVSGTTRVAEKSVTIVNVQTSTTVFLEVNHGAHGQVSRVPNLSSFTPGAQVVLRAIPVTNYRFTGWSGDATGTANPLTVTMNGDKRITANFVFDSMYFGPVRVTLSPAGAVAAGARWKLGNGPWQSNGAEVVPEWNGSNNIFFSEVPGYTSPPTAAINVVSGQVNEFSGAYVSNLPKGAIQMVLHPTGAVEAGAQWRKVGTDGWSDSGAVLGDLEAGSHLLEFRSASGWTSPSVQSVAVADGTTTIASAFYLPPAGAPHVFSILPAVGSIEGGTSVALSGANFTSGTQVTFGNVPAASVTVESATRLIAVTPAHDVGPANVQVTSAGGSVTKTNGFHFGPQRGVNLQLETTIGGAINAIDALDNRTYVGQGAALVVFDSTSKNNIQVISRTVLDGLINDVVAFRGSNSRTYVAVATSGGGFGSSLSVPDGTLEVLDVTDATAVTRVATVPTQGEAQKLSIRGGMAYIANGFGGLLVVNLASPASPKVEVALRDIHYCAGLHVDVGAGGLFAYLATADSGLVRIVDVTDLRNVRLVGEFSHGAQWQRVYSLAKKGSYLYVSAAGGVAVLGRAYDVSNPASVPAGTNFFPSRAGGLVAQGDYLYWAGDSGNALSIFDIANPASPTRVSASSNSSEGARRIAARDGYVYIANEDGGVQIFDVNNRLSPVLVADRRFGGSHPTTLLPLADGQSLVLGTGNSITEIFSIGNLAQAARIASLPIYSRGFVQNGNFVWGSNSIIDVSAPSQPVVRSQFATIDHSTGVSPGQLGNLVVWSGAKADFSGYGLFVVNPTNASNPSTLGSFALPWSTSRNIAVSGNRAFMALRTDGVHSFRVFDLSSASNPREIGSIQLGVLNGASAVTSNGSTAYVVRGYPDRGIAIVDVNQSQPQFLGNILESAFANSLTISGNRLVAACGGDGVFVFDISNPAQPVQIANYNTAGWGAYAVLAGDALYVADGAAGVSILKMQDYRPPFVAIINPTATGSYSTVSDTITLGGIASDDREVVRVAWASDRSGGGEAVGTDDWFAPSVRLLPGENRLTITGFDARGNVGSATITVNYAAPDSIAPAMSVDYPTSSPVFDSTTATIELRGTATDNSAVSVVQWTNARGGSGTAVGTESWSANVPLSPGPNAVTLLARDPAGNETTLNLVITFFERDSVAPMIGIQFPARTGFFETSEPFINLSGFASDERGLEQIRWLNDRGFQGEADGLSTWRVNHVPLLPGLNVITVSASDIGGNSTSDEILIRYQASPQFFENPSDRLVRFGAAASFGAFASGSPTLQWEMSTDDGHSWSAIQDAGIFSGVNSGTLMITALAPNIDGSRFRVVATNAAGTTISTAASLRFLNDYSLWRGQHFSSGDFGSDAVSGPLADPDGDGVKNLVEYVTGLNPKTSNVFDALQVVRDGDDWVIIHSKRQGVIDVTYSVDVSSDLTSWTEIASTAELLSSSSGIEKWRLRFPATQSEPAFFRLRIAMTQ